VQDSAITGDGIGEPSKALFFYHTDGITFLHIIDEMSILRVMMDDCIYQVSVNS
jgi:hypothetical protein